MHEADLYGGQTGEGLGGTTIEHAVARSADASRGGDYSNCLYACRFCNRSRSAKPNLQGKARLLDPTRQAWGRYFAAVDDRLLPTKGNIDAEYTHQAYALDDPRKVERRRARRELITDRLRLLARLEAETADLLKLAGAARRHSLQMFGDVMAEIRQLREDAKRAWSDLRRYVVVPRDAPWTCRCAPTRVGSLPEELERQAVDVPDSSS